MTVSFHKFGDMFFPGTGDVKVIPLLGIFMSRFSFYLLHSLEYTLLEPCVIYLNLFDLIICREPSG